MNSAAVVVCILVAASGVTAARGQTPAPATTPTPAASSTVQPISHSLGLIVYPAKNQSSTQQGTDEQECYNWAKTNTGIDPQAPPPEATVAADQGPKGQRVKSAARGAAAGAVVGEVANNDADEGAKVGATAGVIAGGRQARQDKKASAENAQASAEAAQNQRITTFRKAFGTCLQGRGYTTA
jgi:hypothetical protein